MVGQGDTHNVFPIRRLLFGQYYFIRMCTPPNQCTEEKYKTSLEWDAKLYIGISLKWWYNLRKVKLSIPIYVPDAIN